MSYDFKAIQLNGFVFRNTGLLFSNTDLLSNRVHTFKIRQQQSASAAFFNNDAVNLRIKFCFRRDLFSRFQDINLVDKVFEFFRLYRRKARITRAGGYTVSDNFKGNIGLCWLRCTDAASLASVFMKRNEHAGFFIHHICGQIIRKRCILPGLNKSFDA